jgi:hypothetical protein
MPQPVTLDVQIEPRVFRGVKPRLGYLPVNGPWRESSRAANGRSSRD